MWVSSTQHRLVTDKNARVAPILLPLGYAEDLKIAMKAEAKSWKVLFGRNMSAKYLSLMGKIMTMIDDFTKRLSRPIKDLDDVRQAMAALKEVRENEIFIDTSLDPIEVKK